MRIHYRGKSFHFLGPSIRTVTLSSSYFRPHKMGSPRKSQERADHVKLQDDIAHNVRRRMHLIEGPCDGRDAPELDI